MGRGRVGEGESGGGGGGGEEKSGGGKQYKVFSRMTFL